MTGDIAVNMLTEMSRDMIGETSGDLSANTPAKMPGQENG